MAAKIYASIHNHIRELFSGNAGSYSAGSTRTGMQYFQIDRPGPKAFHGEEKMTDKSSKEISNLKRVIDYHRRVFRIPENLNHYSREDFKVAERKFLKFKLAGYEGPLLDGV